VQRPLEYGGLGIHNLEKLGWALRIRWFWAQKKIPQDLGLVFRFKFLSLQKQCFAWRLTVLLVMGNQFYSRIEGQVAERQNHY